MSRRGDVDKSAENGIIKAAETVTSGEKVDKYMESDIMKLDKSTFVNAEDNLFINADKIKPLDGFDDIVIHGTSKSLLIYGKNGEEWEYNAEQAAEMIRNSQAFSNRPIRLIACNVGQGENCIAQQIADKLGVDVLAATEAVIVDINGEMFVSDNIILADIWNASNEEDRKNIKATGKWAVFRPQEG